MYRCVTLKFRLINNRHFIFFSQTFYRSLLKCVCAFDALKSNSNSNCSKDSREWRYFPLLSVFKRKNTQIPLYTIRDLGSQVTQLAPSLGECVIQQELAVQSWLPWDKAMVRSKAGLGLEWVGEVHTLHAFRTLLAADDIPQCWWLAQC